jgi:formylglycine-generating enzyme required for sulfatase activity
MFHWLRNGRRGRLYAMALLLVVGAAGVAPGVAQAKPSIDREFQECTECPKMVAVPGGKFVMGSPAAEQGRFDAEGPQHAVAVKAFAIGKYDVTTREFLTFLRETGYEPPLCDTTWNMGWQVPRRGIAYAPGGPGVPPLEPAYCLNWNDAQAYIAWLNGKVRHLASAAGAPAGPYRLPSEAEWEYAARAGTATARWWGDAVGEGMANCHGCGSKWDGREIAPVGSFGPNPFGVYDMLGNVWQWVEDCWNESYVGAPTDGRAWTSGDCGKRVLRGGSWSNVPVFARSAMRSKGDARGQGFDYSSYAGFRLVRSLR